MTDLDNEDDTGPVTGVLGDFYQAYKKGTLEFLEFVRKVGEDGLASGNLNIEDKDQVDRGLGILRSKSADLFRLLAKRIDEDSPSFWDECIVEHFWSLLGGVVQVKKAQLAHVKLANGKNGALREAIKKEGQLCT